MAKVLVHDNFKSQNNPLKILFPETKLAINAAIKAGKPILKVYKQKFSFTLKDDKGPLTEADLKSQEIILKELSKMSYPIISEEGNKEGSDNSKTWIIDPLDGTSDFISKTGEFSVMISLVQDRIPLIGVVYQPTNKMLYTAQKGCGAYKKKDSEWSKLSTNNVSNLSECRAVVSRHHLEEHEVSFLDKLKVSNFTQRGSCGLKVAELCRGDAELYFAVSNRIKQWDTCAAYCIIKESGGKMTDMLGNDLKYGIEPMNHQNGILATNGVIHSKVLKEYKAFLKKTI